MDKAIDEKNQTCSCGGSCFVGFAGIKVKEGYKSVAPGFCSACGKGVKIIINDFYIEENEKWLKSATI